MPIAPRRPKAKRFISVRDPRSAVYSGADGQTLFVPTEDMWAVHEASGLSAILKRADISKATFDGWKSTHKDRWSAVLDWLHTYDHQLVNVKRPVPEGLDPTPGMYKFRQEASVKYIAIAARRSKERATEARQKKLGLDNSHVSERLIGSWLKKHDDLPWFEAWLLRGEDAPESVTVATADQVRAARQAWDYMAHCIEAGISDDTYRSWMSRRLLPNAKWLAWLFGVREPENVFVVPPALQKLRVELSIEGKCRAAETWPSTYRAWLADDEQLKVLKEARALANKPGRRKDAPPIWSEQALEVDARVRRTTWRFAIKELLSECCGRADLTVSEYQNLLRRAKAIGADQELDQFLKIDGAYGKAKNRSRGLVHARLFIPSSDMLAFREIAQKAAAECKLSQMRVRDLPAAEQWFLDSVRPRAIGGHRLGVNGHIAEANGTDDQAATRQGITLPSDWRGQAIVDGVPKYFSGVVQFKVIKALVQAGDLGLGKDELEVISSRARRMLRELKTDTAWAPHIRTPGKPYGRYRIM